MGLEALIIGGIIAGASAGFGISKAVSGGNKQQAQAPAAPQPLPQPPVPATAVPEAAAKATENVNRRRAAASQSIYSSPLGVQGEANVVRKTLLGN